MKKISIAYDKKADVLYMSFGKPSKAVGEEVNDGIFARYDPRKKQLVGFTVTNSSKKFTAKHREIRIPEHVVR